MNALSVRGLTKRYPHFCLDAVSFDVAEGHIAGLIGGNGAGKSTLLKGILHLIDAAGEVSVFGEPFRADEVRLKQQIGFVGGGFRFYPMKRLAAIRSVYAAFYQNWNDETYRSCLRRFGLDERKRVRELSDGMKVKFSLALALSHGAKLLLLDEPTSGLDPLSREEFCDILLSLSREEKTTVLFSTHISSDLLRTADDVLLLSHGKLPESRPLPELLARWKTVLFSTAKEAAAANAVGIKKTKDGFEGLVPQGAPLPANAACRAATLDEILIHLEQTQKEDNAHADTH